MNITKKETDSDTKERTSDYHRKEEYEGNFSLGSGRHTLLDVRYSQVCIVHHWEHNQYSIITVNGKLTFLIFYAIF